MKKEGRTFIADVVAFTEGVGSTRVWRNGGGRSSYESLC